MSHASRQGAEAQSTTGVLAATLVPSFLAVIAVAALITSLHVWKQQDADAGALPGVDSPRTSASRDALSAASSPATPAPSASATAENEGPTASAVATPTASPTPSETRTKPASRLPIAVLNQTRRSGLAARVAARLRTAGWTVVQIGNFRGNVPATTVYYPDGAGGQAAAVAKELPTSARTRGVFGQLPKNRLTVVVTDDYPRAG